MDIFKKECFLRVFAILVLVLEVFLVRFDSQTKVVIVATKATYGYLNALVVLVRVAAAAAGYSFLQLLLKIFIYSKHKPNLLVSYQTLAWICFVLDQVTAYVVFATNAGVLTDAVFALTGSASFEWMKLCDRYSKFCLQLGFAVFFGFIASFFLVAISFISAFNLFRQYLSRHFFRLKS